jgi:Xaa-Pro aminopeptidase
MTRFLAFMAREAPKGTLTEIDAAETLLAFRRELPLFQGRSINTISSTGANGAVIHYRPHPDTNLRILPGYLYLVDSGAQFLDGTTDITRTIAVGPPSEEQRRRFTLVLKGAIGLSLLRFPAGATGTHLDVIARQFLWREGLDFSHGSGHGVGSYLGVHEGPQRIAKLMNTTALAPGMIVSNEPGYYKPGQYGMRFENLLVVQPVDDLPQAEQPMLRFETLSLAPIDRALIDASLLSGCERQWIDAYHSRVGTSLRALLGREDAIWLADATRPLVD